MPLPLLWLGAGLAGAIVGHKLYKENQKHDDVVRVFPGEDKTPVKPADGSIVSCGIYGVFEHTGIWINGDIIELKGNGLVRCISPERFLDDRSGNQIYVACDGLMSPLVSHVALNNAVDKIYSYIDYHVLNNNCHRFSWYCVSGRHEAIVRFSDLNQKLSQFFHQAVHWQPIL